MHRQRDHLVLKTKTESQAKDTATPKTGKTSVMAIRLASRNVDPNRLLDAPPEPKAATPPRLEPGQSEPDSDFDEMDFNSLMIE